jgi:hypothetical protein
MRALKIILMITLMFVFAGCSSEESFRGKVQSIVCGDEVFGVTVYDDENDYRQVNLPMVISSSFNSVENEATQMVFDLVKKKQVEVKIIGSLDEHQRLGFVYIDNQDIALQLLKKGYLKVDPESEFAVDYPDAHKKYLDAQRLAQEKNIGMWANDNEPEDKDNPYNQ